jgi:hypothetical protein
MLGLDPELVYTTGIESRRGDADEVTRDHDTGIVLEGAPWFSE